jgi:PAS domain S-box-containing protein
VERLLDDAHDAIIVRDFDGAIVFWNGGAERKYGWSKKEALGKTAHHLLQTVFPEPPERIVRKLLAEDHWEGELIHTRRDGQRITVLSRQAIHRKSSGAPLVLEINRRTGEPDDRERRKGEDEAAMRDVVERLLHSEDEERRRLSKALGENCAVNLAGILNRLQVLRKSVARSGDLAAQKWLSECVELAENTAGTLCRLSTSLCPPSLDTQGLGAAVCGYADEISVDGQIQLAIDCQPDLPRLPQNAERSLYQLARAGMALIRGRFDQPTVKIRLASDPAEFILEIRGEGASTRGAANESVQGASENDAASVMRERMRQLGGRLDLASGPSHLLLRAVVPLGGSAK